MGQYWYVMKSFVRTLTYVILSLGFTQGLLSSFVYGSNPFKAYFLFVLALTILYLFLRPLLGIVSLPAKGFGYSFMSFVLTLAIVYVLSVVVSEFSAKSAYLENLIIFGFVLPSKSFTGLTALVVSSLSVSLFYGYFDWLASKK